MSSPEALSALLSTGAAPVARPSRFHGVRTTRYVAAAALTATGH